MQKNPEKTNEPIRRKDVNGQTNRGDFIGPRCYAWVQRIKKALQHI